MVDEEESGQLSLFGSSQETRLNIPNADVLYVPRYYSRTESVDLLRVLIAETPWSQESVSMYGKKVAIPRLTAWYGDPGATYRYSGIRNTPLPWTKLLLDVRHRLEQFSGASFNCALLNYYRSGDDSISWHSDDERELGENPVIASLSLGSSRTFKLRHKIRQDLDIEKLILENGSLLLMKGETQKFWKHEISKERRVTEPRVNLTFRKVHVT